MTSAETVQPARIVVADVSVSNATVDVGGTTTVIAKVANTGGSSGRITTSLTMFGQTIDRGNVTVPANSVGEVVFTQRIDSTGTYAQAVNCQRAMVRVVGEAPDPLVTVEGTGDVDRSYPLWIAAGGVLALGTFGLLVNRRDRPRSVPRRPSAITRRPVRKIRLRHIVREPCRASTGIREHRSTGADVSGSVGARLITAEGV